MPVNILGFSVAISEPYSVGHVCTEHEALALNRIMVRGIAKGLHGVISRACAQLGYSSGDMMTEADRDSVMEMANEFVTTFSLGFARGHETLRAIDVEARRIALSALETALYKRGQRMADISEEERNEKIAELLWLPSIRREAEKRVEDNQRLASAAHAELLAALGEGEEEKGRD